MTDETREQIRDYDIRTAADNYATVNAIPDEDYEYVALRDGFCAGATHQHPIAYSQGLAEGRRQAVEDALNELETLRPLIDGFTEFLHTNDLRHAKSNMLDACLKVIEGMKA